MEKFKRELTLQDVVPYAAYELEFKDPETVVPGVMVAICQGMPGLLFYEYEDEIHYFDLYAIKPLLIPLDQITDEEYESFGYKNAGWYCRNIIKNQQLPYRHFQYLISKHYDVFGLLDAGLALNKNEYQDTK